MKTFWVVLFVIVISVACTEGGLLDYLKKVFNKINIFKRRPVITNQFSTRPIHSSLATQHPKVNSRLASPYKDAFNDKLWKKQWYAQDYRVNDGPVMDLNLVPVYRMGITGRGVTVAVVDLDANVIHRDLEPNFDPELSYDVCHNTRGPPIPHDLKSRHHWLQSAGVIGMAANNSYCGVGVAYNVKIVAIVDQCGRNDMTNDARGFLWKLDKIDIYTNSWGIQDTDLPQRTNNALIRGIKEGRGGKGAVYVFAAGNDRETGYHCFLNPYTNHHATITIAAASPTGQILNYSSRCAAVLVTAYSGEDDGAEKVVTLSKNNGCSNQFHGTSAAAPMAAGVFALVLEANPDLTYRDVKHLVTMSAEVAPLANNPGTWQRNGAGFWVSHDFGFGLINAENMVLLAKDWKRVPEERTCIHSVVLEKEIQFYAKVPAQMKQYIDACTDTADFIGFLEQVQLTFTVKYPYRGALSINMTSPSGTKSVLLETRLGDKRDKPYIEKTITSVQSWGEDPEGIWIVDLMFTFPDDDDDVSGNVGTFTFTMRGLSEPPAHFHQLPRTYAGFRLPDGQTSQDPLRPKEPLSL